MSRSSLKKSNMDFHEPDLEDLIQSDLRSEMNKILNQSDPSAHESDISTTQKINAVKTEDLKQTDDPFSNKNNNDATPHHDDTDLCSKETFQNIQNQNINKEDSVNNFFDIVSSVSENTAVKTESQLTEFSGHFSLERFPTSTTTVASFIDGQPVKSEQSDLSNLAWLTGVDVQQTLQRGEMLLSEGESNSDLLPVNTPFPNSACVPDIENTAISNMPYNNGQLQNIDNNISSHSEGRPSMRFTPIQPNPNVDCHQRYILQHGSAGQRTILPMTDQMAPHRFGPQTGYHHYPPPPYGTSGANFMPEGYHGRYQNQTQKVFPKPVYSYSCLIAMSLRASKTGCLPVSDIYNFMMSNFPYFKTAPDGWKNSVRHNLSLNKCFEKVEKPNGSQRKGCLWALNPAKISKMEEEVQKWKRKDPDAIRKSMSNPEELDRELEEIRRNDEEAARRRMLSLSSHGLSMATSPLSYHPYSRHHRQMQNSPHSRHMHPSGTSSLPTTPQHYHQHRTPYRQPMTPNEGMSNNLTGYHGMEGDHNHMRQPRQLFNYPMDPQNYSLGSPGVSSTPIPSIKLGSNQEPVVANQMKNSLISSPYSSSSSSGNTSFFGGLADTISTSGHDLNDIDLDSSLADLSALPGWDEAGAALTSQQMIGDVSVDAFNDNGPQMLQPHPRIGSSSSIGAIDQGATSEAADSDVFSAATTRFGGDISYFNNNNKTVMLH